MVALLDVNVLIALFDPAHVHHEAAHAWLEVNHRYGWATSSLTENGFVRVLSNPGYRGCGTTVDDAASRLATFCSVKEHEFWPDAVSLLETFPLAAYPGPSSDHRRLSAGLSSLESGTACGLRCDNLGRAVEGAKAENLALVAV